MTDTQLPEGIEAIESPLPGFRIDTPLCTGTIYLNGAHVAEWAPRDAEPVLWLSEKSEFVEGSPIRGGVPICFPWFGPGRSGDQQVKHGFARLLPWTLVEATVSDAGEARLAFDLTSADVDDPSGFTGDFTAHYVVGMGSGLNLALTVTAGTEPLDFEEALHTYFAVGDVHQVSVTGLEDAVYLDKVGEPAEHTQQGAVTFEGETDRVYDSAANTVLDDPATGRKVRIEKANSATTVVWNPWTEKAAAMADFGDQEWTGMCCVETANALGHAIQLEPGESHTMTVAIDADA